MNLDTRIDELVEKFPSGGVVAIEVATLLEQARGESPRSVTAWLNAHAEEFVGLVVQQRLVSQRAHGVSARGSQTFKEWEQQAEKARANDEPPPRSPFDRPYCVNADHQWKPLGDMVREDCLYVAEDRRKRINAQLLEEKFMHHIAKKLGERTVREVFTEAQIVAMWNGLSK